MRKVNFEPLSSITLDLFKSSWVSVLSLELVLLDTADYIRSNNINSDSVHVALKELGKEADYIYEMLKASDGTFPF